MSFDPSRGKMLAFIKDDDPDCPGKTNVAIVQQTTPGEGELIDFRSCSSRDEMIGFMALYGIENPKPVWTRPSQSTHSEGA